MRRLCSPILDDGGRGVARERSDPMTTLNAGIASYDEMKSSHHGRGAGQAVRKNRGADSVVYLNRVLRQGSIGRQSRTAPRHHQEGPKFTATRSSFHLYLAP